MALDNERPGISDWLALATQALVVAIGLLVGLQWLFERLGWWASLRAGVGALGEWVRTGILLLDANPWLANSASYGVLGSLVFHLLARAYNPSGHSTDPNHIWVLEGTGGYFRDATVKDVYEKQHGRGSWEEKVQGEKRLIGAFGFVLSVGGLWGWLHWGHHFALGSSLLLTAPAATAYFIHTRAARYVEVSLGVFGPLLVGFLIFGLLPMCSLWNLGYQLLGPHGPEELSAWFDARGPGWSGVVYHLLNLGLLLTLAALATPALVGWRKEDEDGS